MCWSHPSHDLKSSHAKTAFGRWADHAPMRNAGSGWLGSSHGTSWRAMARRNSGIALERLSNPSPWGWVSCASRHDWGAQMKTWLAESWSPMPSVHPWLGGFPRLGTVHASMLVPFRKRLPVAVANDCKERMMRYGLSVTRSSDLRDPVDESGPGDGSADAGHRPITPARSQRNQDSLLIASI